MAISHSPENTAVHHGTSTAAKRTSRNIDHQIEETKEYRTEQRTEYRKRRKVPTTINVVKKTEDDASATSTSPIFSSEFQSRHRLRPDVQVKITKAEPMGKPHKKLTGSVAVVSTSDPTK